MIICIRIYDYSCRYYCGHNENNIHYSGTTSYSKLNYWLACVYSNSVFKTENRKQIFNRSFYCTPGLDNHVKQREKDILKRGAI